MMTKACAAAVLVLSSLASASANDPSSGTHPGQTRMERRESGPEIDVSRFRYARPLPAGEAGPVVLSLDAAVLAHSAGPAQRFRDVRIADQSGHQLPYAVERLSQPLVVSLPPPGLIDRQPDSSHPRAPTRYRLHLPFSGLPPATLLLRTRSGPFDRTVTVGFDTVPSDRRRLSRFEVLSGCDWRHATPGADPPPCELQIPTLPATTVIITVDDGDNAPLPIASAKLLLPSYQLRYLRPPDFLTLYYGQPDLAEPRYDLTRLSATLLDGDAAVIAPGAERRLEAALAEPPMAMAPWLFYSILGLAVAIILWLIVRLVAARA